MSAFPRYTQPMTMIRLIHIVLSLTLALSSVACGLRGPLYLPDEADQTASQSEDDNEDKRRRRIPSPQSQKESRDTDPATGDSGSTVPQPDPDRPASPPATPGGD